MLEVVTRAGIVERLLGYRRQAQRFVEFSAKEQSAVEGDFRSVEFELQLLTETDP